MGASVVWGAIEEGPVIALAFTIHPFVNRHSRRAVSGRFLLREVKVV